MKTNFLIFLIISVSAFSLISCQKSKSSDREARLIFKFKFDSTQQRLNNLGQAANMPTNHAGQHPVFNNMAAHYIELAPSATTPLGSGRVLYYADETTTGGTKAIDFEKEAVYGNNEEFFSIPLKDIATGEYNYLRVSLAYQNYSIKFQIDTVIGGQIFKLENTGTIASFIGFNTYLKSFKVKDKSVTVNGNRLQGYWAFESLIPTPVGNVSYLVEGQAPAGSTTVPNPLAATSPIPAGSCVVTGAFKNSKLKITGQETENIIIEVSLSTNNSFEWEEVIADGKWQPAKGEKVVDMGIRGMEARILQ
ncbi:hypothetical protein DVR12_26600 [Chitinophaga silvatica]|uniref:Fimbrillin family protein n=1 Tax=Chitinophaga silvatica TaxID=2282649 RepID=A0A3E1Y287_9BACT|nr:hypothetical protein [Chitinophaga silvatica]RFS18771.1 hypothetical protein DVR12_26600 [Chitinophaga silvatica]